MSIDASTLSTKPGIDSSSLFSIVFLGGIFATEIFLFTKIFLDRVLPNTNKDSKEKTKEESEYEDIFDDLISSNRQVIIVRGVPGVGKRTFIEKLIDYNLMDCILVYDILQTGKLLELTIQRSLITGMPLDRVGASIASFDFSIVLTCNVSLDDSSSIFPNFFFLKDKDFYFSSN